MKFCPALEEAVLVRRYKRFLADIREAGNVSTVHCANTGAMHGCSDPGSKVWYSTSDNPRRKLSRSLELVETRSGHLVCVNTARANQLVSEALCQRQIKQLSDCAEWNREVSIPQTRSRFDFASGNVVVEVKMVSWLRQGMGVFPDAVSVRARRHVQALQECAADGWRAVLMFCVPHNGIQSISIAADVDPAYAAAISQASANGVEVLAYRWSVSPRVWHLAEQIPFELPNHL